MVASDNLVDKVVEVATVYLGPSAERFIYRQVDIHLNKDPQKLTTADLMVLADWSKIALALVTSDKQEVDHFEADLLKLINSAAASNKATRTKRPKATKV